VADELQGGWVIVAGEREGQPADLLEDLRFRDGRFLFEGDRVTMSTGGLERSGTFTPHPGDDPRAIDICLEDGTGKLFLGIYAFHSGRLMLCLATDGGRRPADFATHSEAHAVLFVLEREGVARPAPSPPAGRQSFFSAVPWRWRDVLIGLLPMGAVVTAPAWLPLVSPEGWWILTLLFTAWLLGYPLWVARRRHASPLRFPGLRAFAIETALAVLLLLALWAVLALLATAGAWLFDWPDTSDPSLEPVVRSTDRASTVGILLLAVVVAPVAEEVFFRGMLFNALAQRLPWVVAALVQAIVFALLHLYALPQTTLLAITGLILAAVYRWRKTLLAPILLHSLHNATVVALTVWFVAANPGPPFLGVEWDPHEQGCRVTGVIPGSGAEEAGLRAGDVLVVVDGQSVSDRRHVTAVIRRRQVGDRIRVEFLRGGELRQVEVTLKERPQ